MSTTFTIAVTLGEVFKVGDVMKDLSTFLMIAAPALGGVMVGYHAIMKSQAGDESTASQHAKSMKNVLISTVIVLGAGGVINWVASRGVTPQDVATPPVAAAPCPAGQTRNAAGQCV